MGTHDVSILEFGGGVFEVLASDGDTHLGGSDIDEKVVNWLIDEFKNDEGQDLSKDPMALQRLKEAAEKAKIELSSSVSTEINLPYITAIDGVPKHLVRTLSRAKFESLISDIINRTIEPCKAALKAASLSVNDIDEIILVGGSTRIPAVQKAVEEYFGKAPSHGVNPDEAVSIGASIQGAILNKEDGVGDIVLLDVTPLNLGIETMGNVLTTLVESNTTIPCKKTMTFSNAQDMQSMASIMVYSGNRPMAYQNKLLGQFNIDITPSPKGRNQIEVSFDIDANGILTVSAVDKALNKPNKITIEASSNLTKEEIERMKAEADANADADKKLKETADKINMADSMAFSIEKSMEEMKDKINDSDEEENLRRIVLPIESIDYNVALIANQLGIVSAMASRDNIYLKAEQAGEIQVEGVPLQAGQVNQVDANTIQQPTYTGGGTVNLNINGTIELTGGGQGVGKLTAQDIKRIIDNNPELQRHIADVITGRQGRNGNAGRNNYENADNRRGTTNGTATGGM